MSFSHRCLGETGSERQQASKKMQPMTHAMAAKMAFAHGCNKKSARTEGAGA